MVLRIFLYLFLLEYVDGITSDLIIAYFGRIGKRTAKIGAQLDKLLPELGGKDGTLKTLEKLQAARNQAQQKLTELLAQMRDSVQNPTLEQAVIDLLAEHGAAARRLDGAPGVYVDRGGDAVWPAKIAALGLRIRRGCSYHGLALNVDMELAPFSAINPCGYAGMPVTQTRDLGIDLTPAQAGEALTRHLIRLLENPLESP